MKTISDPWSTNAQQNSDEVLHSFEDSFEIDPTKLSDSEQYLEKLHSRLKALKGGTSKRDLVNSLSVVKEESIARLITSGRSFETEEEADLARNPLIRHIAPHLQALTASELVHLLKADVLDVVTSKQYEDTIAGQIEETPINQEEQKNS